MKLISKIISKLEFYYWCNWFNPFATVYVNFRSFPISQAIKLPVYIYGRPKLYSLFGTMEIVGCKVKHGMITINKVQGGCPSNTSVQSNIHNDGKMIFRGKAIIGTGTKILTLGNGIISFGDDVKITDYCNICAFTNVEIGDHSRIVHRCQVMDGNFHYIANIEKKTIRRYAHPIYIGKYCWICNGTSVTGGASLPNFTIVASNSLVGKNYMDIPEYSMIGGVPAKLIKTGFRRVENKDISQEVTKYFKDNPDEKYFDYSALHTDDDISLIVH